jgi:hypothetical protein
MTVVCCIAVTTSLRANGSRECAPDDRLREAIHLSICGAMDCFASLAMTGQIVRLQIHRLATPRHPAFSPSCYFPLAAKRFMVPARFALGEIEFMINIKGLA